MIIKVGDSASYTRTIGEEEVALYAKITGDSNSVHLDEEYARNTIFKGRIAHGMLVSGLISTVLGTILPGLGTIYLSQSLKFLAPVRLGDTVTATVRVVEINREKKRARLETVCTNQLGKEVVAGEAVVKNDQVEFS
ncbi:MAG: hypothetical protein JL50_00245 [Peptococcaceae bacterium BICA1-7]|nr:MAG: hypothetical protein JL50_00245 [Peptococcaceae bacterium BICA1-7]HBV98186.1 enoyl-CoA hydratase [Desulfotomaculum sp.]